jgi:F-type H+-transporting ATPase subunit g
VTTFQSYFQHLLKTARNPKTIFSQATPASKATPDGILAQIRNVNSTQLAAGGVLLAEVLGFFTVGEIIGRMKFIGYKGDSAEAHH